MKRRPLLTLFAGLILSAGNLFAQDATGAAGSVSYKGKEGAGKGKHIVLLAGDEEYRSEEAMPMLAKLLSERHGFDTTVCFSVNKEGVIDPTAGGSLTNSAALEKADAIMMSLRFRAWADADMERFEKAFLAGKPIIALRTSTHAFNFPKSSKWAKYGWNNEGGFGKKTLGETWVSHWGGHKSQATGGVIEEANKGDALLRGVADIFGDTDVYEAHPPADAKILVRGAVLAGMNPTDKPIEGKKNNPMMPVVWTREIKNEAGNTNKIFTTTMGSATDLANEGLRRLVVNSVFWGLGLEVPAKADVTIVGDFKPTMYGFGTFQKGVKPEDHALKP